MVRLGYEKPSQLEGLPRWLEIATEGLVAPAKERIRTEIETHYSEAMAAHTAEGASESVAQMAALGELGDAKAAAKRFRKQHLTKSEAKTLRWASSGFGLVGMYLGFCFLYFLHPPDLGETHYLTPATFFALEFFTLVIFSTVIFFMARGKSARRNMGLFNLLYSLNVYFSMAAMWYYVAGPHLASFILLSSICQPILPLRLWFKLRNAPEAWQEIPPPQTAAS
jgi:hypothetical protein